MGMSARVRNKIRKEVYRRDGYMCAICGDPRQLSIHHIIKRSLGGQEWPQNLITLCPYCHMTTHGDVFLSAEEGAEWGERITTQEDMEQAITEYMADYYAGIHGLLWEPEKAVLARLDTPFRR